MQNAEKQYNEEYEIVPIDEGRERLEALLSVIADQLYQEGLLTIKGFEKQQELVNKYYPHSTKPAE